MLALTNGLKVSLSVQVQVQLPAGGDWFDTDYFSAGTVGLYWTSTLNNPYSAPRIDVSSNGTNWYNDPRKGGLSIRPVQ